MKLSEAMARADALRPNAASEEQKARWVWELDGQVGEMMGLPPRPFPWPEQGPELRLPAPYEEVYVLYLCCKLDYYNQEMGLCANDTALYNAALGEARGWWRRYHRPRRSGHWRVM